MKTTRILHGMILAVLLMLVACTGQNTTNDAASSTPAQQDPAIAGAYSTIVFGKVTMTSEIKESYPEVGEELVAGAMSKLLIDSKYPKVTKDNGGKKSKSTLLVTVSITDMRLVSTAARIWGGAFAGSSYMEMDIEFINYAGKVIRSKHLNSSNNAWAAAWTGGSSDHSLPTDMGNLLAKYIETTVPAK